MTNWRVTFLSRLIILCLIGPLLALVVMSLACAFGLWATEHFLTFLIYWGWGSLSAFVFAVYSSWGDFREVCKVSIAVCLLCSAGSVLAAILSRATD